MDGEYITSKITGIYLTMDGDGVVHLKNNKFINSYITVEPL